jgi:hypothetical protein
MVMMPKIVGKLLPRKLYIFGEVEEKTGFVVFKSV